MRSAAVPLLISLAACAPSLWDDARQREAERELMAAGAPVPDTPPGAVARERERLRWQSDDWVAGKVSRVGDQQLVVEPYVPGVGSMVFILDPQTPLFHRDATVTREALRPGADVRAFYVVPAQGAPGVVALELLDENEARRMREQFGDLPPLRHEAPPAPRPEAGPPAGAVPQGT